VNIGYLREYKTRNRVTKVLCTHLMWCTGLLNPSDERIHQYLISIDYNFDRVRLDIVESFPFQCSDSDWNLAVTEVVEVLSSNGFNGK